MTIESSPHYGHFLPLQSWAETCALLRADISFYQQILGAGFFKLLCAKGLWLLLAQRISTYFHSQRQARIPMHFGLLLAGIASSLAVFLCVIFTKSQICGNNIVAGGVFLSNHGELIFAPEQIGSGSLVHEKVTIGVGLFDLRRPRIGNNVWIGPDCLIYGDITVGDGATLLPGTVLAKSIPAGVVMQGNPARVVATQADNSVLRRSQSTDIQAFMASITQPTQKGEANV